MIAAAHLDNFLFLLFVAIWIFFQLLTRLATKAGKRSSDETKRRAASTPQPARPSREETDEDRIRKFLEALGQPTTSKPPPPVASRPTYQKTVVLPRPKAPIARRILSPLPPLTTQPPDVPTELQTPPVSAVPAESELQRVVQPVAQAAPDRVPSKPNIATLLRSTSGLRDAIILREIFGPPRSLQPLDLVGNV